MRGAMTWRWGLAAGLAAAGCRGGDGDGAGSETTTDVAVDLPAPDFLEPAGGELHLEVTRTLDVTLDVSAEIGRTLLVIDGTTVGTLPAGARPGRLDEQGLHLTLRGAMVPGKHTLQLRTTDAVASEVSETVAVFLEPVGARTLGVGASTPVGEGDALVIGGSDGDGVLGVVIHGANPRLVAWRATDDGWDLQRPRTLALPGYVAPVGAAAVAVLGRSDGDGERLRAAWRVGAPGAAIAVVDVAWNGDDDGTVTLGLAADGGWLGTREWVEIDRPWLLGDMVLAEITARVDSELAHPGDHVLGRARVDDLAHPQLVPLGALDVDASAPALDVLGGPARLGVRIDHRRLALLEIDGGLINEVPSAAAAAASPEWGDLDGPIVTALGAFDSRIAAGLRNDARAVLVAWIDDGGANEAVTRWFELPDGAAATAAPAIGVLDGLAVVVVPRGDAELVAIPTATTGITAPQVLAGAHCDAVALPRAANASAALHLACLREGAVQVVTLVAQ